MIVDGHVHIHPCFDLQVMLDAALSNFHHLERPEAAYFLALSESRTQNYFAYLQQLAISESAFDGERVQAAAERFSEDPGDKDPDDKDLGDKDLGDWQILLTADPGALVARKCKTQPLQSDGVSNDDVCADIYILAGRQIVTEENLEVLALATAELFDDGYPLEETIQQVLEKGGVPVIPWGFGKWMGRRGKRLQALLKSPPAGLFLADSSSRPDFWPEPVFFEQARRAGLAILSGTDPFPLRSEMGRAGLAGFKIAGALEATKPATSLRQALFRASHVLDKRPVSSRSVLSSASVSGRAVSSDVSNSDLSGSDESDSLPAIYPLPSVYGPLETPFRCFRNQLAMQFIKRFRSPA